MCVCVFHPGDTSIVTGGRKKPVHSTITPASRRHQSHITIPRNNRQLMPSTHSVSTTASASHSSRRERRRTNIPERAGFNREQEVRHATVVSVDRPTSIREGDGGSLSAPPRLLGPIPDTLQLLHSEYGDAHTFNPSLTLSR